MLPARAVHLHLGPDGIRGGGARARYLAQVLDAQVPVCGGIEGREEKPKRHIVERRRAAIDVARTAEVSPAVIATARVNRRMVWHCVRDVVDRIDEPVSGTIELAESRLVEHERIGVAESHRRATVRADARVLVEEGLWSIGAHGGRGVPESIERDRTEVEGLVEIIVERDDARVVHVIDSITLEKRRGANLLCEVQRAGHMQLREQEHVVIERRRGPQLLHACLGRVPLDRRDLLTQRVVQGRRELVEEHEHVVQVNAVVCDHRVGARRAHDDAAKSPLIRLADGVILGEEGIVRKPRVTRRGCAA